MDHGTCQWQPPLLTSAQIADLSVLRFAIQHVQQSKDLLATFLDFGDLGVLRYIGQYWFKKHIGEKFVNV